MKDIAVVYMVAGLSARFKGKLKWLSKVTSNETLIEYSINQALDSGITKIIFIVGEKTKIPFKEKFGDSYKGIPVYYTIQSYNPNERDKPWGTLDAICTIKNIIDCPFIVCSGDDIYGEEAYTLLANHLKNQQTEATVGYKLKNVISKEGTVNRGTFKTDQDNNVISIEEVCNITKRNIKEKGLNENTLCSMLLFGLHQETLELLEKILTDFKQKHKGDREIESWLPSSLGNIIKEGKITMKTYPTDAKWMGITNPGDEIIIQKELKKINQ